MLMRSVSSRFHCLFSIGFSVLAASTLAEASVLGKGEQTYRQDVTYHQFGAFWDEGGSNNNLPSTASIVNTAFNYSYGLLDSFQTDFRLGVGKATFGSSENSGLSEAAIRVRTQLLAGNESGLNGLDIGFGYRHPLGEDGDGDRVDALSDGVSRFDLNLSSGHLLGDWFLSWEASYIYRLGAPNDQLQLNGSFSRMISERWVLGPTFSFVTTLGGLSFSEATANDQSVFSDLNETVGGLGGFVQYVVSEGTSLSFSTLFKLVGRNTDAGFTVATGLQFSF